MSEWMVLSALVASGIMVAWMHHTRPRLQQKARSGLDETYLKGVNYLLNDQQDEAIELFVRALEVNHETVEIHLALGKLFRQRGEVDRAIRLHQNLIARPNLDRERKEQALFELGQDYLCAGLLDRAERLFSDLLPSRRLGQVARRQLVRVYEEEREWEKALMVARRLPRDRHTRAIAHYYCELAGQARERGEPGPTQRLLRRALAVDKGCVRATLELARLDLDRGRQRKAFERLLQLREQDAAFLPLAVEPLMEAYRGMGEPRRQAEILLGLLPTVPGRAALESWVALLVSLRGAEAARTALQERLEAHPSLPVLLSYLDLAPGATCAGLAAELRSALTRLVREGEHFACTACGFRATRLYWRCPGCKTWGAMKPEEEPIGA